jgi:YqxM protein
MRRKRFSSYKSWKGRTCYPYLITGFLCLVMLSNVEVAPTQSMFTGQAKADANFQAASSFWDKSSLRFVGQSSESGVIQANVENAGSGNMQRPVPYEIYRSTKGNPKTNGAIVSSGELRPLAAGEKETLTFQTDSAGNYMFKLYQSSGHPGTGVAWSDTITVQNMTADDATADSQEKKPDDPAPSPSASPAESPAAVEPPSTEPAPAGETPPPTQETPSTAGETPPATQETPPTAGETPPATQETPPTADETPPATQETPPTADETPPATQETAPGTQETAPTAEQTPPPRPAVNDNAQQQPTPTEENAQ